MAVSGSARTRVLVIDDDQDLGALLARYLRGFDFEVSIARDATDGDVVFVMSSGAFGGVHEKILQRLASTAQRVE